MEYIELAVALAIVAVSVFAVVYFTKQHRAEQTEEQKKDEANGNYWHFADGHWHSFHTCICIVSSFGRSSGRV